MNRLKTATLNPNLYLFIGCLSAAAAAYSVWSYLQAASRSVAVAVAAQDLEPYVPIPEGSLRLESRPLAGLAPDALRSVAAAAGRRPRARIVAGDPVRAAHLSEQAGNPLAAAVFREFPAAGGYGALSLDLPPGMAVGGKLRAGDVVDVLPGAPGPATGPAPGSAPGALERVRVLDVVRPEAAGASGRLIAVLALTRPEAERLLSWTAAGAVALRLLPTGTLPRGADGADGGADGGAAPRGTDAAAAPAAPSPAGEVKADALAGKR